MEKESYFNAIEFYLQPSVGLRSYLNYILHERTFKRKHTLKLSDKYFSTLLFISSGTIRLYAVQEDQQITIRFWHKNQFLVPMCLLNIYTQKDLYLEFLEDSAITCYAEKHTDNLYKLFPEYRELLNQLYQQHISELILQATSLAHLDANARYENLMKSNPALFNICGLKIIANYLGIHPKVLSHLRSKSVKR